MAETTGIAWTDATFNPWIGCTKVGPGCDHCYAETLDKRYRWGGAEHWGPGVPRMRTSESNWRKPLTWQRHAENGFLPDGKTPHNGRRPRVFCASLADWLDMDAPDAWRHDLIDLIEKTRGLDWLLLTKRIGRLKFWTHALLPNVWIGATIVNQAEADRDMPKLLATPAAKRFVSYEPALGPIDWKPFLWEASAASCRHETRRHLGLPAIDWIIVGGESTQGAPARPFNLKWARSTVEQCLAAGVAPFVKQLGAAPFVDGSQFVVVLNDRRAGAEPQSWPAHLRVQEFPA